MCLNTSNSHPQTLSTEPNKDLAKLIRIEEADSTKYFPYLIYDDQDVNPE